MHKNQNDQTLLLSLANRINHMDFIDLTLVICIIYGAICKLLISINMSLNSDEVNAGMVSLEIWRHKNYFLQSYYFPSADPFWFSDIIPFHLIPQLISNFNPACIKIICYIIFLLIIFIFSIVIYRISNDFSSTLVFAAFMANLHPESVRFYLIPTCHNATLFFVGILVFLMILKSDFIFNIKTFFGIILLNLIIFSDSIMIAWFLIPFIGCYIFYYKNKGYASHFFILTATISSILIYIYKNYFIKNFVTIPIHLESLNHIFRENLPLYIEGLSILLFGNQNRILIFISFIFLIFLLFCFLPNQTINQKFAFFIFSAIVIFFGYVFTDLPIDIGTTRYLTFSALSIFLLVSLAYQKNNKLQNFLIMILLFLSIYSNSIYISNLDFNSNKNELELASFLYKNNLTKGYADYWDSNVITYLSNEKITILPIMVNQDKMVPFRWLTCEKWYSRDIPDSYFILIKSNVFLKRDEINLFAEHNRFNRTLQFGSYIIYTFDGKPIIEV